MAVVVEEEEVVVVHLLQQWLLHQLWQCLQAQQQVWVQLHL